MYKTWLAALILSISLFPMPAWAQPAPAPYVNHGKFFRQVIETKGFQDEMPLAKFLRALVKQLPKEEKISLRIDEEAFGDDFCEVAATPVRLPIHPERMNLGTALRLAISKIKIKIDYRLGTSEFVITTPERARYTAVHDIRDVKPETLAYFTESKKNGRLRNLDSGQKAALLVQEIFSQSDWSNLWGLKQVRSNPEDIQVLNNTRLVIRGNEERHAQVDNMLQAFRRLGDLAVIVKTRLYEVDRAFYTQLKNMKPISLEEEEKLLLAGKPSPWDPLFKLRNQKLVLKGDEIKVDDGKKPVLLSRHKVVTCLPSPEQARKGEKGRQTILLGVSFRGQIQVSPDRRSVLVKLTEKATELQQIKKIKGEILGGEPMVLGEIPFLTVTTHTRILEIPDGGTILVPVHARTKDLPKDRFWVLAISPRIWIGEEERMIEKGELAEILPVVLFDILKNPRLKNLRELYGSPGDKRFALVNSPAWTWTKEDRPAAWITGLQLTPAQRTGKRLLGIRMDRYQQEKDGDYVITVALVNAGGSDNGPVIGRGTIRYTAQQMEKGWQVELAEK